MAFEGILVEVLLGAIVTLYSGLLLALWRYIQNMEQELSNVKDEVEKNRSLIREISNHYFGFEQDETNGGFVSELEEQFESIHTKIDEVEKNREDEHREVKNYLDEIVQVLSEKESVENISVSDFDP